MPRAALARGVPGLPAPASDERDAAEIQEQNQEAITA
jgi:hypothetical protein